MLFKRTPKEKDNQAHFNDQIKIIEGAWHRKLSDRYQSNIPDNVVIYKGVTYWIEIKAPGKELRPGQASVGKQIANAGGVFIWLSTKDAINAFIDRLIDGYPSAMDKGSYEV